MNKVNKVTIKHDEEKANYEIDVHLSIDGKELKSCQTICQPQYTLLRQVFTEKQIIEDRIHTVRHEAQKQYPGITLDISNYEIEYL